MSVISKELSLQLREAGLQQPKRGLHSFYRTHDQFGNPEPENSYVYTLREYVHPEHVWKWLWAPRLDQLLEEIRKYNCGWGIGTREDKYCCIIETQNLRQVTQGDTLEEATGQALLWLITRKNDEERNK